MAMPPYDRAIALPCRMSIFRDHWLCVHYLSLPMVERQVAGAP
jgi:hypothetical protein